ncbi:MAG: DUF1249 domain-containing protein [Pseudomonadales bacterium]|nr:DUF1249 domain-containing protein [Pseudomonadales bacterium]
MERRSYNIDLSTHLAECDANFVRLNRLFPSMETSDLYECQLVTPAHTARLTFKVLERCPYTTIIRISQIALDHGLDFELPAPSITVRMYMDTRSVEVVEIQNQDRFRPVYAYPNEKMRQHDEKVQVNRFLGEYLSFCYEQGLADSEHTEAYLREWENR